MATDSVPDLREKLHKSTYSHSQKEYRKKYVTNARQTHSNVSNSIPRSKYDDLDSEQREEEVQKVKTGIEQHRTFTEKQCYEIEKKIDKVVKISDLGLYKEHTVDR